MRAHTHTYMDTESFAGTGSITHSSETQLGKYQLELTRATFCYKI